ncbi:sulfite exporter TauE/SafE family protein [Loktanella agnita]|uniref:sulfite exporter TauE/SafE family protein n=1 Tax=Loktanella agnita TaxID=287097 RepID=UPI003986B009
MENLLVLAAMGALLLLSGAVSGVLAGLLGVGGGIVLVPAFFYVFGALGFGGPDLMQLCLGTSLATIIVTSIRSTLAHDRKGAVDWAILKSWVPGIVVGALLGMLVASRLSSTVLQAMFGGLAAIVGLYLAFGQEHWRVGQRMPGGIIRVVMSSVMGFFSVLMGIGGGSFGVPIMTAFNVPIHKAVGTAAGFGLAIAVPSVAGFLFTQVTAAPPLTVGSVNLIAFGLVVLMTVLTAPFGATLAHRTDAGALRRIFGFFLIIVALNMLRDVLF